MEQKQQKENKDVKKETNELEQLKKQLAEKEKIIQDYTNHLKRLQAEFENYIKRTDKERCDLQEFVKQKLILKLLIIVDQFRSALEQLKQHQQVPEEFTKGVEMIFNNFHKVIEEEGVREIVCKGKALDPYKHEVMLQINTDEYPENTIVDELQKGYMFNDKVLRYAKVSISKPKNNKQNNTEGVKNG